MSDVFYPLGGIASSEIELLDRTIADEFESGATSSRRLWPDKTFKRRFTIEHQNLTVAKFNLLRDFFTARSGRYDSFWFRDNVHRNGNAKVRLAKPFPIERSGRMTYNPKLVFEQTAPIRALPTVSEIYAATGYAPYLWLDANRQLWSRDGIAPSTSSSTYVVDNPIYRSDTNADAVGSTKVLTWNSYPYPDTTSECLQYMPWVLTGAQYAADAVATTAYGASKPAHTFFTIVKVDALTSAERVFWGASGSNAGESVGIQITSGNKIAPWLGGGETWTGALYTPVAGTWYTVAVVWAASSDVATLYVNGALVGTKSNTRSQFNFKHHLGGTLSGGSKLAGSIMQAAHFVGELDAAGVLALHNLLAYQAGL